MKKLTASILSATLMLSMVFSSSVFAANDATTKASAWDSFVGLFTKATATTETANVQYRGHVQDYGDVPANGTWVQEDSQLGTTGESKRIEGFKIELTDGNTLPAGTQIRYNVHIENEGWQHNPDDIVNTSTWTKDGAFAGSVAKSQRVEAIEIVLTDANGVKLEGYSVQYMVHVENLGWSQGWVADGAIAGTEGRSFRLEAIRIKITQVKADLTAYNTALAAVTQADYTTASWTTYQAVVNANKVTEDNTQAQVNTATANITAAQGNLVLIPKVASVTALNATQVKVTFNTQMGVATASNAVNYKLLQGNTDKAITLAELSSDKKEVTLTLATTAPLTNVDLPYTLNVDGVVDYSTGATISKYSGVFTLSDKVRPVAGDLVWADAQTLSFTIDKDIKAENTDANGIDIDRFVAVYDANGVKQFGFNAAANKSHYNVNTNKPNTVTVDVSGLVAGDYTVRVLGLTDYAVNLINPNPTEKAFTVSKDVTAPTVQSITPIGYDGANVTFDVVFSEKLNATVPTIDIDDSTKSVTVVNTSTDGKTQTLKVAGSTGLHKVTVKGYADLANNAGQSTAKMVTFAASTPTLVSAQYQATATGNKIVVKFDRNIPVATLSASDLKTGSYTVSNVLTNLSNTTYIPLAGLSVADVDGDNINELLIDADTGFTTDSNANQIAMPAGNFSVTLPAGLVKDSANQSNKLLTINYVVPTSVATTTKVISATQNIVNNGDANYVYVAFDAKVADASALTASNYTVEGNAIFTNPVFINTDKKVVRLTANSGAIKTDGSYTVAVNGVIDTNGKAVESYSAATNLSENEKSYIAAAEITANNQVKVTFNEALTGSINNDDLEVYVGGTKVASTVAFTTGNSVATITLNSALTSQTTAVVVKTASTFNVMDGNFNVGVTGFEKTAVWNVVADTSVPTISAGAIARTSATAGTVTFTPSEAGTYYYGVVGAGASAPTIDTTGVGTACTAAAKTADITLTTGPKDVYVVVKDGAGNVSAATKFAMPGEVAPTLTGFTWAAGTTAGTQATAVPAGTLKYVVAASAQTQPKVGDAATAYTTSLSANTDIAATAGQHISVVSVDAGGLITGYYDVVVDAANVK